MWFGKREDLLKAGLPFFTLKTLPGKMIFFGAFRKLEINEMPLKYYHV